MFCIEAKQMKMNGNWEKERDQGEQRGKGIKLPAMWQSGNLKCNPKKAKANPETKAMFVLLLLLLLIYFIPFQFRAHFMHMILILAKHTRVCVCVCVCVSAICHSSSSFLLPSPTAVWLPCCLLLPVCVCVLTHICAVCNLIWLCTCEKAKWNEIGTRQKADSHGDGAHTVPSLAISSPTTSLSPFPSVPPASVLIQLSVLLPCSSLFWLVPLPPSHSLFGLFFWCGHCQRPHKALDSVTAVKCWQQLEAPHAAATRRCRCRCCCCR